MSRRWMDITEVDKNSRRKRVVRTQILAERGVVKPVGQLQERIERLEVATTMSVDTEV